MTKERQIQKYIADKYNVKISKSSIAQVKNKYRIKKLEKCAEHG